MATARRARCASQTILRQKKRVARFFWVGGAGKYGAKRIYENQSAVLGEMSAGAIVREMADGERWPLAAIVEDFAERDVGPTLMPPLWHFAGYALDSATAVLGWEGAIVCTETVEDVIDGHYVRQEQALGCTESPLRKKILEFRTGELAY